MVISGMATSFQITQYTDETFTSHKQTLTPTEAGDQIYLEISPTSLDHSVFNFAPTMCKVVDVETGLEFTIYDIETNKCSEPVYCQQKALKMMIVVDVCLKSITTH
jgi:hypothetical protein